MEIHIRRGRRTDYEALCALGAWPGVDDNPRRSIRMFRKVVADLAYDLYVADQQGEAVGMVTVSYVRVLGLGAQRATLEELVVRPDRRGTGVGRALFEVGMRRARRRGARALRAVPPDEQAARFLDRMGLRGAGSLYQTELRPDGQAGGMEER